jgi:chemotaxis protein methyltransferase CheR
MSRQPISPQVLTILSALIEERLGLHYGPSDKDLLGDKVALRASEAGFDSLLDYYYFLRYDPGGEAEFEALVDAVVVGETYFFREIDPLRVLVSEIIAPLVAANPGRRPRIWSAACSTGEEPLTIAMLLADRGLLDRVELLATDVSNRSLARARAGEYGVRALRSHVSVPPFAESYIQSSGDRVRVNDRIRSAVDFRRLNLLDRSAIGALGSFDAIVCRNVLIYFQDATARQVIGDLTHQLVLGGTLLVGVSESLLRLGTALACEERSGVFLYRKGG